MNKKKILLTIFFIAIIVCGFAAAYLYFIDGRSIFNKSIAEDSSKIDSIKKTAKQQTSQGDLKSAISSYDKAISDANNPDTKGALYMEKATAYTYDNDLKSALDASLLAVKNKNDESTLANLAWVYSLMDDKANAIKYYKEAIVCINAKIASEPELSVSLQSYNDEIKRLGGN